MSAQRITQREWLAINAALALVVAGTPDDAYMSEDEHAACATAQRKVIERIREVVQ